MDAAGSVGSLDRWILIEYPAEKKRPRRAECFTPYIGRKKYCGAPDSNKKRVLRLCLCYRRRRRTTTMLMDDLVSQLASLSLDVGRVPQEKASKKIEYKDKGMMFRHRDVQQ